MALGHLNFDQISEADIRALLDNAVPEGMLIEYKRDGYGSSDTDKDEFLKDVSSFANSLGGHLIIGVDECGGLPTQLVGLRSLDPDKEVARLENMARSGIEPRLAGLRIRAVPLLDDSLIIVARVPKSWHPPHRVRARNRNRFYVRNSAGVHEASVDELRVLFSLSANAVDRIRAFRQERVALIAADGGLEQIIGNGRVVLHVVPLAAFGQAVPLEIDLARSYGLHMSFRPLGSVGFSPRINFDGFINVRGGEKCHGYTQVFRNGAIEATKSNLLVRRNQRLLLPNLSIEEHIVAALPSYLDGLRQLDIPPPLVVMITVEGAQGARLGVSDRLLNPDEEQAIPRSELMLPEIIIHDYGSTEDYRRALRIPFDALWNAAGYFGSQNFTEGGDWNPQR